MPNFTVTVQDENSIVRECEYSHEEVSCLLVEVNYPQYFGGVFFDNKTNMYISEALILTGNLKDLPALLEERSYDSQNENY